jgi:hypothetical protein
LAAAFTIGIAEEDVAEATAIAPREYSGGLCGLLQVQQSES